MLSERSVTEISVKRKIGMDLYRMKDRGGYRSDAGCMTNSRGDREYEEYEGSQRPRLMSEWPGC